MSPAEGGDPVRQKESGPPPSRGNSRWSESCALKRKQISTRVKAAIALLRRFLDWDRAVKRLGELNDKVEDPSLWNDPKAAQVVMRERRRLEEAIAATRKMETDLADTIELIEMAEAEGDEGLVDDGGRALAELATSGRTRQGRGAARGRGRRQQQLCRGQCGRRRDRKQ